MEHPALRIPSRLNDGEKFVWWTYDVFGVFAVPTMLGLAQKSMVWTAVGVLVGGVLGRALWRYRLRRHPSWMKHLAHFLCARFGLFALQRTPPASLRVLIG